MVSRYHPVLVVLHWVLAALIIGMLVFGFFVLSETPNSSPNKITLLMWHMSLGMVILALMALRFVVRWRTKHPSHIDTGLVDRAGRMTHWVFYFLIALMAATGLATAIISHLNEIVFAGSGEPLPVNFANIGTWQIHRVLAAVLVMLIAIHLGAVVYHACKGDKTLRRMAWPGKAERR